MTFLNPIAGVVAAAVALPILVLLYFLKLRRRPVRVSSSMLWERAVKDLEVNTPFRMLRVSWPLVLQILAALALVTAIARPSLEGAGGAAGRVIILIDRSASMSTRDGPPDASGVRTTRLEQAKRRARELVESFRRLRSMPEITVAQFAGSAEAVGSPTSNLGIVLETIDAITPTDQPGDLAAVADLLRAMSGKAETGSEESDQPSVTAHVLSDGCNPATTRVVLPDIDVVFDRVGKVATPGSGGGADGSGVTGNDGGADASSRPENLGIVALSARRDYDDPLTVRLLLRVVHVGATEARATARLQLDGEDIGAIPLVLPASTRGPDGPQPGEATTTTAFPCGRGGTITVTLPGEDALAADDQASLVLAAATKPRVMVVGAGQTASSATKPVPRSGGRQAGEPPAEAGASGASVDGLIRSCLLALDVGSMEVVTPLEAATKIASAQSSLALPDLIIYDRVRPESLPPVPSISFGAGLPLEGIRVVADPNATPVRVVSWRRTHPLLKNVPLESVVVETPMTIVLDAARPGEKADRAGMQSLAEGPDGSLMAIVDHAGVKRIVIGFALAESNWGPTASFPVFLAGAVDYLTLRGESQAARSQTTGEPLVVRWAQGAKEVSVNRVLKGSDGAAKAEVQTRRVSTGDPTLSFGAPLRCGVYEFMGAEPADSLIAVNLASTGESDIEGGAAFPIAGVGKPSGAGGSKSTRGEIWHYFVVLAAGLMTIEWFVVAWRMRL